MVYFDVLSSKMQEERSNKVLHSSTGPFSLAFVHTRGTKNLAAGGTQNEKSVQTISPSSWHLGARDLVH